MGRLSALMPALLLLLPMHAEAESQRRVALVVGNGSYEAAVTLANPVNDAQDIAARLRSLGFTVIEGRDLGKRELERKAGEFADALDGAAVGLFYYAGHGLGVGGQNYLVPVDARLDVLLKLQLEAVPLGEILGIMQAQAETSLVFLDACSNNPFAENSRSATALAGFAPVEVSDDAFVAFSTQDGATASDGSGRNSPFAAALLQHMGEPGLTIPELMRQVRRDVRSATRRSQVPFVKDSLLEPFAFVPDGAAQPAKPEAAPQDSVEVAALDRSMGDAQTIEAFVREEYLALPPGAIDGTVRKLYGPSATIFGAPLTLDAIAKAKTDWFAQWRAWTLRLEPNSLRVAPQGAEFADVEFAMRFDYAPRLPSAAHATGRAGVWLRLARQGDGWRIVSETSQALP